METDPDLDNAYDLKSEDDHRRLYRDWAATYDADFAERRGYTLPDRVATAFAAIAGETDMPVLDIGAGTGLVADALPDGGCTIIDALDLSSDMLEIARGKRRYRRYVALDLATHAIGSAEQYGAILSSGSFTIGHLGADALTDAFRLLKPGGLYVFSINKAHYSAGGFAAAFEALEPVVSSPELQMVDIFNAATGDGHDNDQAYIAIGRKHMK